MARTKVNKYTWNKRIPVTSLNYSQSSTASNNKYKFVRNPVLSNTPFSTKNSAPLPSDNTFRSVNTWSRSHVCVRPTASPKKNTQAGPFARFKFIKVPESTKSQPTKSPRTYRTAYKLARNSAYKFVARGYTIAGATQRGRTAVGISSTIGLPPRRRYRSSLQGNRSRYRYIRRYSNDSISRAGSSLTDHTKVANRPVGRRCSPIQNSGWKYQKNQSIFRRAPVCNTYIMTGMCEAGSDCTSIHDDNYIRICPRYLHHRCPLGRFLCPLAHVLDPCRLPICEFYEKSGCTRVNCPYLHTSSSRDTPICPDFQKGRCPRGRTCSKRHIWLTKKVRKANTSKDRRSSTHSFPVSQIATTSDHPDTPLSETQAPLFMSLLPSVSPLPAGSLRNIFPPPNFIPLMNDEDTGE